MVETAVEKVLLSFKLASPSIAHQLVDHTTYPISPFVDTQDTVEGFGAVQGTGPAGAPHLESNEGSHREGESTTSSVPAQESFAYNRTACPTQERDLPTIGTDEFITWANWNMDWECTTQPADT
jgi:hypothetical protein